MRESVASAFQIVAQSEGAAISRAANSAISEALLSGSKIPYRITFESFAAVTRDCRGASAGPQFYDS